MQILASPKIGSIVVALLVVLHLFLRVTLGYGQSSPDLLVVALLMGKSVENKVAMTGEITLRGNVLPIGGVKEKVTAAHRSGIKTIILPDHNRKDLEDIPEHIKKDLDFHFAKEMMDVIDVALPGLNGRKKTIKKSTSKTKKVA